MTRLDAQLVDFSLVRSGDQITAYRFRFGKCEEFATTLEEFKQAIPLDEREPMPEKSWLWTVKASPRNHAALAEIFDNFEVSYQAASSQLPLF